MCALESGSHTLWFVRQPMGTGTELNRAIQLLIEAKPMWVRLSKFDSMDPDPAEMQNHVCCPAVSVPLHDNRAKCKSQLLKGICRRKTMIR